MPFTFCSNLKPKDFKSTLHSPTFAASGAEARPRWGYRYGGWGVGAGVVGAIAAGAIIAGATRPAYGYGYYDAPAPVRSCDMVERFETRKLVDRAKGLLNEKMGLSEPEAFRWIQKASMDRRLTMQDVAKAIIEQLSPKKS